ncbi:hypothetical protein [Agrobacterium vitis]|uniref:Uncharacterized protein n=1 Tax=Agrobacterium vitis TaxID=373 RepID=A0A7K1RE59_AGRVI|nr:hypothetical protein [Agrobacterium vitis]MVA56294.1 hypothetical protein [Agrobacterium vitis]
MTEEVDPNSFLPLRYAEYAEKFGPYTKALKEQHAKDVEFARANHAIVTEGPWDGIPSRQVAYIGIDACGKRVHLHEISSSWRFKPISTRVAMAAGGDVIVQRIALGRQLPGMVVGRVAGQAPVQSYGLIDGKDYYFRARGSAWSLSVGGADVVANPEWYYEEPYGVWPNAGFITDDQSYEFIAKAAGLYRSGTATMAEAP